MKFNNLVLTAILIFITSSGIIFSQSIGFASPLNGQTITNTNSLATETTIPVDFEYSYSTTPFPPAYSIGSFIKLIANSTTYSTAEGGTIPGYFQLGAGSYTWRIELWEQYSGESFTRKTAEQTITFYVKHSIAVHNNFGGGSIEIDGITTSSSTVYKFSGENLLVGAIDQTYSSREQVWNTSGTNNSYWQRKGKNQLNFIDLSGATSRTYNYTVASNDNGSNIQA